MLNVAVDTVITRPPFRFGGIFEYTRHMLKNFGEMATEQDVVITELRGTDCAPEIAVLPESDRYRVVLSPTMRWIRFWRLAGCHLQARRVGADVLFSPNPEVLPYRTIPAVTMVHDIAYRKVDGFSKAQSWYMFQAMRQVVKRCRYVLANSECSKADIVQDLGVSPERVIVTYLAHNHELYNTTPVFEAVRSRVAARYGLEKPYILHHGTLQPRKNLVRLISAYKLMLDRHPDLAIDLVLVGNLGWRYQPIFEAAARVTAPGRVVITGGVEERDLPVLVKGAELSIVPSLYEGFCFPMLESMACGVPTIVANNSCLPEVSGGALRYFDAESIDEIAQAMYDVLQDIEEQKRLRAAGLLRANEFRWRRCARETLRILRAAAFGN